MTVYQWEKSVIASIGAWPHNGFLYQFFNFWTDFKESRWAVLALILIFGFTLGWKKIIAPLLLCVLSVALTDSISRYVVKAYFMRPRPHFVDGLCALPKCWGFVSSHASNISGVAMVLCLYNKKNIFWVLPIALLVGLSRIYFADHFPLDVLGGFALGSVIGWLVFKTYDFISVQWTFIKRGK